MQSPRAALTTQLASYVVSARAVELPDQVRSEALRAFFNIIGCTLGGARHNGVELIDRTLPPSAESVHAMVLGRSRRIDALLAALINCLASSIYSFDDTL